MKAKFLISTFRERLQKKATNIKRDTFRHFVPIAIPQSRVEAGFKPALLAGGLSRLTLVAQKKKYITLGKSITVNA